MTNTLKMSLITAAFLSLSALAQDGAPATTTAPAKDAPKAMTAAPTTKATKTATVASNKPKMKIKEAKEACLKENAALKGDELKKCIKDKRFAM